MCMIFQSVIRKFVNETLIPGFQSLPCWFLSFWCKYADVAKGQTYSSNPNPNHNTFSCVCTNKYPCNLLHYTMPFKKNWHMSIIWWSTNCIWFSFLFSQWYRDQHTCLAMVVLILQGKFGSLVSVALNSSNTVLIIPFLNFMWWNCSPSILFSFMGLKWWQNKINNKLKELA